MGTLYLVSTPIGNLEDITLRAIKILKRAILIAAEDTRQSRKLLNHYGIETPLISYHEHNKLKKLDEIIAALTEGDVALVSDAGAPAINDPGYELVRAVLHAGFSVSPIPGPSAPIAALIVSGLPTDSFHYLGYLPNKSKGRKQALARVVDYPHTLIFLETPHRLLDALADIETSLGDRDLCVAREMTKLHEEFFRGKVSGAIEHFSASAPRGEITLIVAGNPAKPQRWEKDIVQQEIMNFLQQGESPSQTASKVAALSGWPRREVYKLLIEIQSKLDERDG